MKKTNKALLLGFAIAVLGTLTIRSKADVAEPEVKDCSTVSPEHCHSIELPGGNIMSFTGKPRTPIGPVE